jgi:arylsulfatase A-like enzyme
MIKFSTMNLVCAVAMIGLSFLPSGMIRPTLAQAARPNILIIISDDQGYGEMSAHGNPILQTPHLDRLRAESVRFTDFHVAPMCTPTRGQLMTGVDSFRNGAMNVSSGRTLLRRELPTMPQMFAAGGYATGMFGKWHLGDAFPYRPEDRGFRDALWFPSSHIGSVPDVWNNHYFNDTYIRNGARTPYQGYTTDIFFRQAQDWMKAQGAKKQPFLCYLPTAAPHSPHYVPTQYRTAAQAAFEKVRDRLPVMNAPRVEQLVRYLAMIANLDDNVGRLETFLRESGLRDNTIVVFLTDNGSTFAPEYFPAGMKGNKTQLWEGGHRVPLFVRWPQGNLRAPGDVAGLTQVQDILPTLLELSGVKASRQAKFDGISLAPVLRGQVNPPKDRMFVINFSRMPLNLNARTPDNPAIPRREGAAVLWQRWRLLEDRELYDLSADPLQTRNVIAEHPDVAKRMRAHLDQWWSGVKEQAQQFQPSIIGHTKHNPAILTACEWADVFVDQQSQIRRGERKNSLWHIEAVRAGEYVFELRRWPREANAALSAGIPATKLADGNLPAGVALPIAKARLKLGDFDQTIDLAAADTFASFRVPVKKGRAQLQTWFLDATGKEICGAYYVEARHTK